MSEEHPANSINRRSLLKTIGAASGVAGLGILGTNTAAANQTASEMSTAEIEQLNTIKQQYTTAEVAENTILTHGKQLLGELKNRNIITSVTDLDTTFTPKKKYAQTREGMGMTSFVHNGVPTAHLYVSKRFDDRHLTVVVQPQLQKSYAIVRPTANDQRNVVILHPTTNGHSNGVTTDAQTTTTGQSDGVTTEAYVRCEDKFCLHDYSSDDPTSEDNCWLNSEVYHRLHWYDRNHGSWCELGDFAECCNGSFSSCEEYFHCGSSEACTPGGC